MIIKEYDFEPCEPMDVSKSQESLNLNSICIKDYD
jgi:hypothetical protein